MKTLTELNEELDAFNATLNDENEDTPELLAEQERLFAAIAAAEAADLPTAVGQGIGRPLPKTRSRATPAQRLVQGCAHRPHQRPAAPRRARADTRPRSC